MSFWRAKKIIVNSLKMLIAVSNQTIFTEILTKQILQNENRDPRYQEYPNAR
jgi:spermidine/putrescine-binding protein